MSSALRWIATLTLIVACRGEPGAPDNQVDAQPPMADARMVDGPSGCDLSGQPVSVDILIVVGEGDRSGDTQQTLFAALPAFFEALACELGARPDLHVGVVSTNLGAGGFDVPRCEGNGLDGQLLSAPQRAGCSPPSGDFLTDVEADGMRERNFDGTLTDAVSCIATLGDQGCTFEQPLAAAVRATDPSVSPGFVRAEATLAVIFASGGDDCSAADPSLFDPDELVTLGPVSSFRCFEQGIECTPDDPRTVGAKTDCAPRAPGLVSSVTDLVDALIARKADPADVVIGYIGGIADSVVVRQADGQLELDSACPGPFDAAPAVRLDAIPNVVGAQTCLPVATNLAPLASRIAAAASP